MGIPKNKIKKIVVNERMARIENQGISKTGKKEMHANISTTPITSKEDYTFKKLSIEKALRFVE